MLADSVEAAARTLVSPDREDIEQLVEEIVAAKVEDGQLDQSPLTFADLKAIKQSFVSTLTGMFHQRLRYPDQETENRDSELTEDPTRPQAANSRLGRATVKVDIRDLQALAVEQPLLRRAAQAALRRGGGQLRALSLALVDDHRIQALNRSYRNVDAPTDVIAFEANHQPDGTTGEVIISVETAARQAAEAGHSLEREMGVLVAHGVLHVLGYDDADTKGAQQMSALEDRVLADLEETLRSYDP